MINYIFFVLSIVGILFSFALFYEAGKPYSGDGCIAQISFIPALAIVIIAGLTFRVTYMNIRRLRIKKNENDVSGK